MTLYFFQNKEVVNFSQNLVFYKSLDVYILTHEIGFVKRENLKSGKENVLTSVFWLSSLFFIRMA